MPIAGAGGMARVEVLLDRSFRAVSTAGDG